MGPHLSSNGVSVSKYSTMNTFLWYFFQTLTLSSMVFIVLTIYWAAFSSANIRVVCVIIVAFAIISPSFIMPKLLQIAAVGIPIIELYKNPCIRVLNILVWVYFGYLYPFPGNILCYCLMVGVGLMKLYGDIEGQGAFPFQFISTIGADAVGASLYVFDYEIKYGTGRWVDSSTGWALLGLFAVVALAYYLPPLVKPAEKKQKVITVDHVVKMAEAPILGSGTKGVLEKV